MFSFQVLGIYPCGGVGGIRTPMCLFITALFIMEKKKGNNINIKNSGNV